MAKEVVETREAPQAIGPYSQAIASGTLVFCSGQVALDPATGKLIAGDVAAQTRRALENLKAVLTAANSSLTSVLKTTVYLADLARFQEMNRVYGEYFPAHPPARATVEVSALPAGAAVEIECVALREIPAAASPPEKK